LRGAHAWRSEVIRPGPVPPPARSLGYRLRPTDFRAKATADGRSSRSGKRPRGAHRVLAGKSVGVQPAAQDAAKKGRTWDTKPVHDGTMLSPRIPLGAPHHPLRTGRGAASAGRGLAVGGRQQAGPEPLRRLARRRTACGWLGRGGRRGGSGREGGGALGPERGIGLSLEGAGLSKPAARPSSWRGAFRAR